MSAEEMSGKQLLGFIQERMKPSSYYQPLVICSLAEAGGRMSKEDLAKRLLLENRSAVAGAVKTLMRWPKATLQRHGIVRYHRERKEFELLVDFECSGTRHSVIAACEELIADWQAREAPKTASRFFAVIEAAKGRCQACGRPGSEQPIDVDHIVPQSRAKNGRIKRADGAWVRVDDVSNLQALCSKCNRGKRDASTLDFRPSIDRLAETVRLAIDHGAELGYQQEEILRLANASSELPTESG